MSSYLTVHIEYKRDGKWNLLKMYGPHINRVTTRRYSDGTTEEIEEEPTGGILPDGTKLDVHDNSWHQGIIRDLFCSRTFESEESLCDRGLPTDMSDELSAKFKEMEKEATSDDDGINRKWWYSESYCTLAELSAAVEKRLDKFKEDLSKYNDLLYNNKTNSKLDEILCLLDPSIKTKNSSTDDYDKEDDEYYETDYEEQIDYLWDEEFYDILWLKNFCSNIYSYAEEFAEIYNDNDIRIVVYID